MASTYMNRTLTANNQKKLTISVWVKIAKVQEQMIVSSYSSGSLWGSLYFAGTGQLRFYDYRGSYILQLDSNALYRDTNAWMHIVANFDCSIGSPTAKLYVNGEEVSYATQTIYSQNATTSWNTDYDFQIGKGSDLGGNQFDGQMSDLYFIQGYTYDASTFGETDSTSGIWKPKTNPTINYGGTGGNSCHLKFENSGNMDLDSGDNNVSLTTTGTLTQNVDTPSNNFVTFNPLRPNSISQTYSNGNNTFIRTGTGGQMNGTLGVTSGKWYYECLLDDYWQYLGWTALSLNTSQTAACSDSGSGFYGLYSNATEVYTYANGSNTSQGSYTAMASGQFWGIAFDADNAKMYFSVNGVWENSSDPANQTNPAMSSIPVTDFLVPAIGQGTGSRSSTIKLNFGSGYFGTTVAGTNADANGHGKFKYSVPSGFYTLNTKNIKEFG